MNRAKDLDKIAPDDPIETGSDTVSNTPPAEKSNPKITENPHQPKPEIYTILGHSTTPFTSFLVKPKVLDFPERAEGEEIYLALRPHWFTNLYWVLTTIAMLFAPLIVQYSRLLDFLPINYQLVSLLFWYLITFIFSFEKFLGWYFDLYMITDKRVVDIDFSNMLNKKFAETDIDMIQDVSSSVKGLAGTMFNYGDVLIQTASEVNKITFEKVPNPEKVIKLLEQIRESNETKLKGGKQ